VIAVALSSADENRFLKKYLLYILNEQILITAYE